MNATLSRRAGRLMHEAAIQDLTAVDRAAFLRALAQAANFDTLPARWRDIMLTAERQAEARTGAPLPPLPPAAR